MRLCSVAAALIAVVSAAPALAQQTAAPAPYTAFTAPGAAPPAYVAPAPAVPGYVAPAPAAPPPVTYDVPPAGTPEIAPAPAFVPAAPDGRDTVAPKEEKGQRDFHLDVGFGTEAPISVGGVVTAEVPGRILLQLGLGFMPHGYAYAIDGFLTSVHAYDQTVSNVIRNALGNSFVLRAGAGWRPFKDHGFEITAGYTLMTLGGATTAGDVINAVLAEGGSSQRVPANAMSAEIPLSATLHNVHVSLGWRWLLADDHIVLRASLSYLQCLASNVGVSLANMGGQAAAAEGTVNQALNAYLGPYFTTYAKAPTMGLSAAYRF